MPHESNQLVTVSNLTLTMPDRSCFPHIDLTFRSHRGYLVDGSHDLVGMTLLKTIGGLLPPPPGEPPVRFDGKDIYEADDEELKEIRKHISFIFSEGTLISNLSVRENLFLPLQYHHPCYDCDTILKTIKKDFDFFKIPDILDKRPAEISYNHKKLLAFIRASIQEPRLILMDKPLFNLDDIYHSQVVRYMTEIKQKGIALVIANRFHTMLEPLIDEYIFLENDRPPVVAEKNTPGFQALLTDEYGTYRRHP